MIRPDSIASDPASADSCAGASGRSTNRVVAVSLFVLGVLLFFHHAPNALRWPLRVLWLGAVVWLVIAAVRAVRATRFTGRKIAFILVLGGFYYLVLSLVCHVFVKLMSQRDDRLTTRGMSKLDAECRRGIQATIDDNQFNKFSPEIGWVPRPGYKTPSYTVNAQGLRGTREYPRQPAAPDRRILCMGDSFTFGIAVKDDESYPAQAEQLKPATEWLNFGIPGGCLVQAYQRYMHEARDYGGTRVVVGFMTNDAQRTVNIFRPFVNADSGCPLTKPFAKYDNGKFTIEPNPYHGLDDFKRLLADDRNQLAKLEKLDYLAWSRQGGPTGPISRTLLYVWDALHVDRSTDLLFDARLPLSRVVKSIIPPDPYGRDIWSPASPGFKAICMMFDRFHEQIVADGREALFVIIPGPMDVSDFTRQNPRQYLALAAYFKAKGYAFVDFLDPLVSKHKADLSDDALFVRNHYQPPVNRELAAEIIQALKLP